MCDPHPSLLGDRNITRKGEAVTRVRGLDYVDGPKKFVLTNVACTPCRVTAARERTGMPPSPPAERTQDRRNAPDKLGYAHDNRG
jgi:hypothetical protein